MSSGPAAGASKPGGFGRIAAIGALVLVVIAIAWLVLGGDDDGYNYDLVFETGGQLVEDNEVLIGGAPVGTVNSIELTDNGQAEVSITVNQQLHEGTKAVIRQTSLSGIANRYVSITPGPDNAPGLDDGAIITEVDTTTPVDLDQLFNALRAPERKGLQDVIQGSATTYTGRGEEANETYRYLSPAFVATDQLIQEVNRDQTGPHRLPRQRRPRHRRNRRAPRRPRQPRLQRQPGPRRNRLPERVARPRPRRPAPGPAPGQHHLLQPSTHPRRP